MPDYPITDPETGRKIIIPWPDAGTPDEETIKSALAADRAAIKPPAKSIMEIISGLSSEIQSEGDLFGPVGAGIGLARAVLLRPAAKAFSAASRAARTLTDVPVGKALLALEARSARNLDRLSPDVAETVSAGNAKLKAAGSRLAAQESTIGSELSRAMAGSDLLPTAQPETLTEHLISMAAGTHPALRSAQRTLVGTAADFASDPTTLAPLGALSKLGRIGNQLQYVLSAAMAGAGGEGAMKEAGNIIASIKAGKINSEQDAESAVRALIGAGTALLGVRGFADGFSRDRTLGKIERLRQESDLLRAAGIEATDPAMFPHLDQIVPTVREHIRQRATFKKQQHELNADKAERLGNAFRELASDGDPASTGKVFSALRGENDGVDLKVPDVTPDSQLALRSHIAEAANTGRVDKWTALHALEGLERILGRGPGSGNPLQSERVNATPLELSERAALRAVFGRKFYDTEQATLAEQAPKTLFQRGKDLLGDIVFDAPRALQASADLSAVLRQGGPVTVWNFLRHPLRTATDVATSVHAFASPEAYRVLERGLHDYHYDYTDAAGNKTSVPVTKLADKFGLHRASKAEPLAKRPDLEEYFQSSLAEHIPVVGEIIKGSERAYSAYLDQIRLRQFKEWDELFRSSGSTPDKHPELWKGAAEAINAMTGNSPLPKIEFGKGRELDFNRASPILRMAMFAPRFFYSRLKLLKDMATFGQQAHYPARVRIQAAKIMGSYIGAYTALLAGLSQLVPGVTVETDPRSSDFIKIKVGNTRFDVWAGLQQPTRFAAQMLAGQKKSSSSGKVDDIVGSPGWWARRSAHYLATGELPEVERGVFKDPALSLLSTFAESKASPAFNWLADAMRGGVDLFGKPSPLSPTERFRPFLTRDVAEAAKESPALAGLAVAPAGILGIGTQTYSESDSGKAARSEAQQLRPEKGKKGQAKRLAARVKGDARAQWEVRIRKAMKAGDTDKATDLLIAAGDEGYDFPSIEDELLGPDGSESEGN